MLRNFNLIRNKVKAKNIHEVCLKNKEIEMRSLYLSHGLFKNKQTSKFFFTTSKDDEESKDLKSNIQNPTTKQIEQSGIKIRKQKKQRTKRVTKSLNEVQKKQIEEFISHLEKSQPQQKKTTNQDGQQKIGNDKKSKKDLDKRKSQNQNRTDFIENKLTFQPTSHIGKKTPFYSILFEQNNESNEGQNLLRFLQKSEQKRLEDLGQGKKYEKKNEIKQKKLTKKKKQQKGQKKSKPLFQQRNKLEVLGLQDLIIRANKEIEFPVMDQFEQNLFNVLNQERPVKESQLLVPFGFRYHLFRFCKYQIYFTQIYGHEQLMKNLNKCIETIRYYCFKKRSWQKNVNIDMNFEQRGKNISLFDRSVYMQQFLTNLLPFQNTDAFVDIYLEVGLEYTKILKQRMVKSPNKLQEIVPSVNSLRMIITNIKRLLFKNQLDFEPDDAKEQDYLLYRAFFTDYLDLFCFRKYKFQTADKVQCVEIAKFLKIAHPEFMQFVKEFIQVSLQNFSMVEFLLMMGYLVQNKNTPYEYFYKKKGNWMQIIDSSHDFSSKKTRCCVKLLEIFSRQRFINCQKIYHRLLQIISNNLQAMEGKQLVRTLYYYSRARYGANPIFISSLVDKISRWLPYLEERQFSLLVRSLGNLNYQSSQLVEKLKYINYEKFLLQLKFGCQNLGSYYQEILKQVEAQSRGKYYFDGDQNFEILSTLDSTQNLSTPQVAQSVV